MSNIICPNCQSTFTRQYNLTRHMNRKYPCKRVGKKVSPNNAKQRQITPSIAKYRQEVLEVENEQENTLVERHNTACSFCGKNFKKKQYLYKHFRNTCVLIPENKRIFYINKYNNNTRHKNKQKQLQILENNKINNIQNVKNINSHNTTNNIQNNNIQNNITIKINPFGQEDISSLGKNDIFRLINRAYKMIPDTMKAIHFDIPENRNMYIPNINRPLVKIFNGEEWVYKSLDFVTQMVSDNIKDNMEKWTEKFDKKLSPIKKKALHEFVSKCIEGKMETLFKEELKMFLMTYSNELKDYLNTEVSNKLETMNLDEILSGNEELYFRNLSGDNTSHERKYPKNELIDEKDYCDVEIVL
jgi:hypothetical protein